MFKWWLQGGCNGGYNGGCNENYNNSYIKDNSFIKEINIQLLSKFFDFFLATL